MPTLFYSHGNTLKQRGAMKSFWQVYRRMRCCPGRKRLVCWSWPAQRVIKGLRIRKMIMDNLRLKLTYAEYQGYYMAKLVQQMSLAQRVMLSGHSYGAISVSTAAHWLGGGRLRGLTLAGGAGCSGPISAWADFRRLRQRCRAARPSLWSGLRGRGKGFHDPQRA